MAQEQTKRGGGGDDEGVGPDSGAGQERREKLAEDTDDLLDEIEQRTGVRVLVLSGRDEARLTSLAVRRWRGWSAGRILALDIGGGSLELTLGDDEDPDIAKSLLLGAGRTTRELLPADPPSAQQIKEARRYVRATLAKEIRPYAKASAPDTVLGAGVQTAKRAILDGLIGRPLFAQTSAAGVEVRPQLRAAESAAATAASTSASVAVG